MRFWSVFLLSFFITAVLTPFAIWLAPRIGAMDIPRDKRKVHVRPIPRVGGIAIFFGVSISIFALLYHGNPKVLGLLLGGAIIFVGGLLDDLFNLKPLIKLLIQLSSAVVVFAFGIRINFITRYFIGGGHLDLGIAVSFIITVLWIVGITNTINLIDGLDGLAAGVVAIAACCIGYSGYIHGTYTLCLPMLALAGGAIGFLPFNFYPAKTFMGDCGSQFLGYMMAAGSIIGVVKSTTVIAMIVPILVLGLPIFDTLFAIVRRTVNHRSIMQADRGHLHHKLLKYGMGQRRTVLCMYGICAIMGTAAVLASRQLYVETVGLALVSLLFIYVVLTDRRHLLPQIKDKPAPRPRTRQEQLAVRAKEQEKAKAAIEVKKAEKLDSSILNEFSEDASGGPGQD